MLSFLIATTAFSAEPDLAAFHVVGLATSDCLRSSDPAIKPDTLVTLIVADHSLQIKASIGSRVADCADTTQSAEVGYRINTPNRFDLAIAVIGDVPAFLKAHSCTSSQGINVFIISAARTKALWHGYYNLGHHIESDCMAQDLFQMQERAR